MHQQLIQQNGGGNKTNRTRFKLWPRSFMWATGGLPFDLRCQYACLQTHYADKGHPLRDDVAAAQNQALGGDHLERAP